VLAEVAGRFRDLARGGRQPRHASSSLHLGQCDSYPMIQQLGELRNRLRANARRTRKYWFSEGRLTVQVGDDLLDVNAQEFLAINTWSTSQRGLRDKFHETLRRRLVCAKLFPTGFSCTHGILLTGGRHVLLWWCALQAPSVSWCTREQLPTVFV